MPAQTLELLGNPRRHVRVETLTRLRWISVAGQLAAVLVVAFGFDFSLPFWQCLAVIAIYGWVNIVLKIQFRMTPRVEPERAAWLLAFDIVELAVLIFLTGGLQNPFAFLLLGPVLLAATVLPPRMTLTLGVFSVGCATLLVFLYMPLPWQPDEPLELPPLYIAGVWLSLLIATGFIGAYAWVIAEEARRLADALAATEIVLAREQHLSQLDGLAAAAAHELGTPLATISVVVKELERALAPDSPHTEDIRLLRQQTQRCREILAKIADLPASGAPFDRLAISTLLGEVIAPYRDPSIAIEIVLPSERADEPVGPRNPAILYGLGNLIENAVDFARSRVEIVARWTEHDVVVTISDDGPGFASEVLGKIGEPYVTTRGGSRSSADVAASGLGLGFFIAKTLLERSGATIAFLNRMPPERGAIVRIRWPRADYERRESGEEVRQDATPSIALEGRGTGS